MQYTVFLFDVDGVLLHPQGYKEALRDTVSYFATQMGQPHIIVDDAVIADFEALGVTSEWESVPFCVAVLLQEALQHSHQSVNASLSHTLDIIRDAEISLNLSPFSSLAQVALGYGFQSRRASHIFLEYFKQTTVETWHHLWDELFADVYAITSPTTTIFQAHTLGLDGFNKTYGSLPHIERQSYLLLHDRPHLTPDHYEQLMAWREQATHGMSIFTARPSLPPVDSGAETLGYPPEADLAAELLKMNRIPIIATGRLDWLARQRAVDVANYIKPSPVHALAGIGAALTGHEAKSLQAAVALVEDGHLLSPLEPLKDHSLHLVVFEDSKGGILSTQQSSNLLNSMGVKTTYTAVGVAKEPSKQRALAELGAYVVEDINQGLDWIWQGQKT